MTLALALRARRLLFVAFGAFTLIAGGMVGLSPAAHADVPWTGAPCNGCVPNFLTCSPQNSGWCVRTNGYNPNFPNACQWNSKTHYTSGLWYNSTCNSGYWRQAV